MAHFSKNSIIQALRTGAPDSNPFKRSASSNDSVELEEAKPEKRNSSSKQNFNVKVFLQYLQKIQYSKTVNPEVASSQTFLYDSLRVIFRSSKCGFYAQEFKTSGQSYKALYAHKF